MNETARTVLEAVLIGVAALGVGLLTNSMNRDGLALDRDYFRTSDAAPAVAHPPAAAPAPPAPQAAHAAPAPAPAPAAAPQAEASGFADAEETATAERLRERGLQPLTQAQALAAFHDPQYAAGATIFVDARKDEEYLEGHVPGAWQLDHYHFERYIDTLLPVAQQALQVVVYCHGKDCNDSEQAALDLTGFGVDTSRVAVYVGGWTAWTEAGLPVEKGPRDGAGP
jgi:rhodanese-related sulfurtransferase